MKMSRKEEIEVFKKCVEFYDKRDMYNLAMEECAELIQAINKILRYPDQESRRENLIEEIVDVSIMIEKISLIANITPEEFDRMYERKFDKVRRRLLEDLEEA